MSRLRRPVNWRRWLTGDVHVGRSEPRQVRRDWKRLRNDLAHAARFASRGGPRRKWRINSGYRSLDEQAALYAAYQAGTGNLAARPGTSRHNWGKAADVSASDGRPVGESPTCRAALRRFGLCLPVPGEKWHVEHGDTWRS